MPFCLLASVLLYATSACADFREDAEFAVATLHQNGDAQKLSDDMKSLELVFEVARRYYSKGDWEAADKFYLLALQKSQIIESMLKTSNSPLLPDVEDVQPVPGVSNESPGKEQVAARDAESGSDRIVGSKGVYTVVKADTLRLVSAKLGVTQQHLRSQNSLDVKAHLKVGQKLAYNNRKIIPQQLKNGIIINIPDRTLYYFQHGALVTALPVALGSVVKNEKYVWQTPVGKFKITGKVKDPTWTVPPSIQTEMEEKGKEVVTTVPPGPENPLGKYAIKTSIPGILIHSTTKPSSIYSFSSHGCIRLSPDQMEGIYPQIKVNTRGEIVYKPVKLAVTNNGRVYLEVHKDVYKKSAGLVEEARKLVEKQKLSALVDWGKLKSVVQQKRGIAEDISL
ncbi:MAG: L,D-transpeptidase family protein [Desulfuromonadaceae bacterium]|nr:L,D-transpeptidase family protein [Desulfuromonadaceae bacterium]